MFQNIEHTNFANHPKPLMVFDGTCGFCKYWIVKWKKMTGEAIDYQPYQKVYDQFKDIPKQYFKEAVRLIFPDGKILTGPDAAYFTYYQKGKHTYLHKWYKKYSIFKKGSDWAYQLIADNRSSVFTLSKWFFGKNPNQPKKYWLIYLLCLFVLIIGLVRLC